MSKITDYADKANGYNDRLDAAITRLTAEIQATKDLVEKLKNQSEMTPEEQAALQALESRGLATSNRIEGVSAKVE